MTTNSTKEIQIGDRTHHQDQWMCPVNFRRIKRIVRSPVNPMPPLLELEELLIMMPLF
jgi:hypothetical protein